jgi:hypothetical protein
MCDRSRLPETDDMKEPTIKDTPLKELAEYGVNAALHDDGRATCSACGEVPDQMGHHVDDYHRFTPLCSRCYHTEAVRLSTAYRMAELPRPH